MKYASDDPSSPDSAYQDASVQGLQARGVKFLSCHSSIEEAARALIKTNNLTAQPEEVAKDMQAHIHPGVHPRSGIGVGARYCCRVTGTTATWPPASQSHTKTKGGTGWRILGRVLRDVGWLKTLGAASATLAAGRILGEPDAAAQEPAASATGS